MTENTDQDLNLASPEAICTDAPLITYDDFAKVQMRVGQITKVEEFPKARRPAFKLWIDFGKYGTKCSSAQITVHYTPDELVGKRIVAVTNFPKKQIGNFFSEVLVLGASQEDGSIVLLSVDKDVPLGSAIS